MAFFRVILGVSVSGQKSLATASDAGADITEAVNKWVGETCDFRRKKANLGIALLLCSELRTQKSPKGKDGQELILCQKTVFLQRLGKVHLAKSASP